jgi:hypothetical protein
MKRYPPPDWRFFAKNTVALAGFLFLLHWIPEMATWIHSVVWGEVMTIDMAKFQRVLYVAYAMVGVAVSVHGAGLLWAVWHSRRRQQ